MSATFNHVQISIDPSLLAEDNLAAIDSFFRDVLGFRRIAIEEKPNVLLYTGADRSQYLVLVGEDEPARLGADDHVGLYTEDPEVYRPIHEAAKAFASRDDQLELTFFDPDGKNGYSAQGIRMRYLLPFNIEVGLHEFEDDDPRHMFSRLFE